MKKVYLETKEDIFDALAEGREIRREGYHFKLYLCRGYLIREFNNGYTEINADMAFDEGIKYYYVEENDAEEDIGKLCWFSDNEVFSVKRIGILQGFVCASKFPYQTETGGVYKYCKRLTEEELEELS